MRRAKNVYYRNRDEDYSVVVDIRNFDEAREALGAFYGFSRPGEYTLDTMRRLMKWLGDPQNSFKSVHIAGTSGKTSTAYFTAALLAEAGYKTGLTVSPHVDEINERVQINMQPLPEEEFCGGLGEFLELVKDSGCQPSYFELMVAYAYWQFAKQAVDYAVVEVGLGGLLDGTNVITRSDKHCLITDIGLDHTEVLGSTIREIASQKAGIIHPSNTVYMHRQGSDVMEVVGETCRVQQADLQVVEPTESPVNDALPSFQQRNFRLAEQAVASILARDNRGVLSDEKKVRASRTYIPARMEMIQRGSQLIIIDGSHNAQKIQTLAMSIAQKYPAKTVAALVGFVESAEASRWQQAVDELLPAAETIIVTSFAGALDYPRRSINPTVVAEYILGRSTYATVIEPAEDAFGELLTCKQDILLVVGSFYLLNHIRPLLKTVRS